jgi:hypothetical protein
MNSLKTSCIEGTSDRPRELMIIVEQLSSAVCSLENVVDAIYKRLDPITTCGPIAAVPPSSIPNENNFDVKYANEISAFISRIDTASRAIGALERNVQI